VSNTVDYNMPFGKHSGVPIAEVPPPYLRWMYQNCDFSYYPELQRALEHLLNIPPDSSIRTGPPPQENPAQPNGNPRVTSYSQPGRSETGLDGFRRAFDKCRREVLIQYQENPDEYDIVEHVLTRVLAALGI